MSKVCPITPGEFARLLRKLCHNGRFPERMGLAVSGGVDSMALSILVRGLVAKTHIQTGVVAFIVDHRARDNSSTEAAAVREMMEKFGFKSEVITLSWPLGSPSGKFEQMARKLRYQALCRACIHHNVQDLLLAHHGDDQAETILMRLVSGTGTRGLAGIQAISPIPECSEIWGAERVKLLRPLLEETKARLIATCNSNGVKWFEDSTNSDPKHTIRNTIRYLQSFQDPPVLPRALSKNSLLAMSSRVKAQMDHDTTILHQVMEMCQIEVCTFSGLLRFTFPREKISSLQECSGSILTQLMIHITSLISPVTQVEPKVLKKAMENLFQLNEDSQSSFTAAGLLWRLHKGKEYSVTWLIHRQPYHTKPTLPRLISGHVLVLEPSSPPRLWDNRFWFRLHSQTSSRPYTILIRPVRRSEFGNVKARLSAQNLNIPIDRAFKGIPDKARYTVPVAVRMDCKQNGLSFEGEQFHESIEEGTVIGFPTLGVWEPGYERDVQVIMRRLEHLYEWELKEELKKGGRNYLDVGLGIRYMSPSLER